MHELDIIQLLTNRQRALPPGILLGIGDDAAILAPPPHPLLWTTDMLVEGIHFSNLVPPTDLGWKSLAVNLSDIAAMAGTPLAYLLSLAWPHVCGESWLQAFCSGLDQCSQAYGVPLIGGDTVGSLDKIVINITVLGYAAKPVLRRGARPGDLIAVTGDFGAAAAGLFALENGMEEEFPRCLYRHLHPLPRLQEARLLAERFSRLGLLDASDGLGRSLQALAQANGLGCQVDMSLVPVLAEVGHLAGLAGCEASQWVIHGGEEYELVCALPAKQAHLIEDLPFPLTVIGEMTTEPGCCLRDGGKETTLEEPAGFRHIGS